MHRTLRVLNIEDSESDASLLRRHLTLAGYDLTFHRIDTPEAMKAALETQEWDVILADYAMPKFSTLKALELLQGTGPDIPFIIISGTIGEERAVEAMLAGADDYLMKDKLARLVPAIERELQEAKNRRARRLAEESLKASEERYRLLFESNPDPTYVFDRESLRFIAVNEATVRQYGYSHEELLSMTISDIQPLAEPPESGNSVPEGTLRKHRRKNGILVDVEVTSYPLEFAEKHCLAGLAHDVTQQKLLEEQFRQAHKMEAVGHLAGGIAHDFNNLLTVINGYGELALLSLPEGHPLRRNIEHIIKAGDRAVSLTRQLLAFSRKQVLQPKVLDLNSVVSNLETMLRRLIGADVQLKTVLQAKVGSIKADPSQIEQILMNLVVNARDAMPRGGKLTIETADAVFDEDYTRQHLAVQPGSYVMLAVSDTGIGMDLRTQARIFEPFFTTKETGKGTGLGLSMVYGIVKQSGGNIWVYSEIGKGTTFKIYFPRVGEAAQPYKRATEPQQVSRGTETILIAEDEEAVRLFTRTVLEKYGYQVLEASNGGAALLICERHKGPIQLLITDLIMPEMSGRDLAERLASLRPEMKVLYMSGYTDNALVHQGVLDGKVPFLQKPFTTENLGSIVREVLGTSLQSPISSNHVSVL